MLIRQTQSTALKPGSVRHDLVTPCASAVPDALNRSLPMHRHARLFAMVAIAVIAIFVVARYEMIYQRAEIAGDRQP